MRYTVVLVAALGALTCNCQTNDLCQLKGYNLEPLTKSVWSVELQKTSCPDKTGNCTLLFALCHSPILCPKGSFACINQNGNTTAVGDDGEARIEEKSADGFNLHFDVTPVNQTKTNGTIIEFSCDSENILEVDFRSQLVGFFKPQQIAPLPHGSHVTIKNALGCKKREGMGPGSQFMLILLVLFLLYFGGGIVYNHVNGARGEELIPHLWFWKNLPSYVVDGCIFCVRFITCQARENYSQNPDYGSTSQAGVSPSGRTYETL